MQIELIIGGIGFLFESSKQFIIHQNLKQFLSHDSADIVIKIVFENEEKKTEYPLCGEDLFCKYYGMNERHIQLKGANGKSSAMVFCDSDMRNLRFEMYPQMQGDSIVLERVLSFLPMRRILYSFEAFILHSSRVEIDGKAILFSGPSGAGKTTQALLWKQYEKTPHLCNDRTIVRHEDSVWNTYGYFQDGSTPIANNKCLPIAAIVFLEHGNENCVHRINGTKALKLLIGQIFMDNWDYEMIAGISEMVVSLLKDIPIYSMQCVPERSAVECLKNKLKEEGVIK